MPIYIADPLPPAMNQLRVEGFVYIFHGRGEFNPTSARKTHILRLNDMLNLFVERGDFKRARRVWAILIRCKEFDWRKKWRMALLLISDSTSYQRDDCTGKLDLLRKLMRQHPNEVWLFSCGINFFTHILQQEAILQEIVLLLTKNCNFNEALEQLESYVKVI